MIEEAVKLTPDEFVNNEIARNRAIKGIKGLANVIIKLGMELFGEKTSEKELPMMLASAKIIKGSTADDLAELLELAQKAEELDFSLLYSNLVRFMEIFEVVYLSFKNHSSESKQPDKNVKPD